MTETDFGAALKRVAAGATLDSNESAAAFSALMRGDVDVARMAAFLTALAVRKPTVPEIVGAVRAMRGAMRTIRAPENAIDVCGTGGDGLGTLNVSTAVAFVVAACGIPVAKHGNRNMSSQTGAADVLEALGLRIDLDPTLSEECLATTGFCFLYAPHYHAAMKHVAPVRRALGFRTIFNLLGPLSNPAGVRRQLIGVFSQEWIGPVAAVLRELRAEAAWAVHSADGMDEISIAAPTSVIKLESGTTTRGEVAPEQAALPRSPIETIRGGNATENARAIHDLLAGARSPFRDIVLLNASAALAIAGTVGDLEAGARLAADAIDSGSAENVLRRAIALSGRAP